MKDSNLGGLYRPLWFRILERILLFIPPQFHGFRIVWLMDKTLEEHANEYWVRYNK